MRGSSRPLRVADRIQVELAEILRRKLKDPRAGFITVTGVEVSQDLRTARVFVSALDEDSLAGALALLDHARGFLRSELGRRLDLRFVPELLFRPDRSAERGRRIEDLLRGIHDGTAPAPDDETASGDGPDDLDDGFEDDSDEDSSEGDDSDGDDDDFDDGDAPAEDDPGGGTPPRGGAPR